MLESGIALQKLLEGYFAIDWVNWQQDSNMIGYKKEHFREIAFLRSKDG